MKLMKGILYLSFTLALVGVLVTSCEKGIIIEEDVEGVKGIIIEEDVDGVKTTGLVNEINLRKGKKIILLKPKLLKEYINILSTKRKLSKKELKDAILNVSMEELQRNFSIGQLSEDVFVIPINPVIPVFGQPCGYTVNTSGDPDNPDNDLNMSCECQEFNLLLYIGTIIDGGCIETASAYCDYLITYNNCYGADEPITDCSEAYGDCP